MSVDPVGALCVLAAYLAGAIPFGLLLAKARGIDVRAAGSGNIGATNVARTAGKGLGVLTLLLDAAKGALVVALARFTLDLPVEWLSGIGVAAVLGHVFSVFLGFKGGKGVATALGVFLVLAPISAGVAVLVFVAAFAIGRIVSVGSLLAAVSFSVHAALTADPAVAIAGGLVTALILFRHRGNLERLKKGQEGRL